ncbi:MAG: O-antigen ligase family protein [Bacteroidales bacterium]|nr:O-antigen ligase family protein [Bacteroidales bacterium]
MLKSITYLSVILLLLPAYAGNEYFVTPSHWFTCLAAGATMLWCGIRLFSRNMEMRMTLPDVAVLIFILYLLFNCLFAAHFPVTHLYVGLLLCCCIVLVMVRQQVSAPYFIPALTVLLLLSGCVQCVWGLLQQFGIISGYQGRFRVVGSFQNPGVYAGYLACIFPFALSVLCGNAPKGQKAPAGVFTLLCLTVLPFTYARAAWAGAVCGMAMVAQYRYGWIQRFVRLKKAVTGMVILFIILSTGTAGYALYRLKPESAQGRILIWKTTLDIFRDHPLAGSGFGTFPREYNIRQAAYFQSGQGNGTEKYLAACNRTAFNEYLQVAAETGLTGIILLSSVFGLLCRIKPVDACSAGAMGSLGSLAVCACFSYPFHEMSIVAVAGCMFLTATCRMKGLELKNRKVAKGINATVLVVAGIIFYRSVMEMQAVRQWEKAVAQTELHSFDATQPEYERLYGKLRHNPYFLYNYGTELIQARQHEKGVALLDETAKYFTDTDVLCSLGDGYTGTGDYDMAEKSYLQASYMVPNKFYPLYCLAKLYRDTDKRDKALNVANEIINKREKVKSYTTYKIRKEMISLRDSLSAFIP